MNLLPAHRLTTFNHYAAAAHAANAPRLKIDSLVYEFLGIDPKAELDPSLSAPRPLRLSPKPPQPAASSETCPGWRDSRGSASLSVN